MRIFKTLVFIIFSFAIYLIPFATVSAQSTISDLVLKQYPPSIITRVYDITAKCDASPAQQRNLANIFVFQDSAITELIMLGKPSKDIDSVKEEFRKKCMNQLSAKQQYYYSIAVDKERNKYKYWFSQFTLAIEYKDSLGLSQATVDTIFLKIDTLNRMKDEFFAKNPGKWFDSKSYESENMSRLLTEEQYMKLLTKKNKERALNSALSDWKEIEQRGLAQNYNKEVEVQRMTEFYIERQNTYDKYEHDKVKQNAALKFVYDNKPKILNALAHARRNPDNNTQGASYKW